MAGVTDQPFRELCFSLGTRLAIGEMLSSNISLWSTRKSKLRLTPARGCAPRWVQIAGADPTMMALAATAQQEQGAEIIDINMGCPAKKVCRRAAGSALMRDEKLVASILESVVAAVDVPVTLKIRTGWCPATRNAVRIARIAEESGIRLLTVHGRTRACRFKAEAEYDTVTAVASAVSLPVVANGNIGDAAGAARVLQRTGAQAVMIGRAAQGQPWLCGQIDHRLRTGRSLPRPSRATVGQLLLAHLDALYTFYGSDMGLRIARKHVGWYLSANGDDGRHRQQFNALMTTESQLTMIGDYFRSAIEHEGIAA